MVSDSCADDFAEDSIGVLILVVMEDGLRLIGGDYKKITLS